MELYGVFFVCVVFVRDMIFKLRVFGSLTHRSESEVKHNPNGSNVEETMKSILKCIGLFLFQNVWVIPTISKTSFHLLRCNSENYELWTKTGPNTHDQETIWGSPLSWHDCETAHNRHGCGSPFNMLAKCTKLLTNYRTWSWSFRQSSSPCLTNTTRMSCPL